MVPRKSEGEPAGRRPLIDDELADQLLGKAQAEGAELLGPDGLLAQVTKAVLERALAEEMTGHLGYEKHDPAGRGSGNSRNGTTGKTVLTGIGAVDLAVPRDRDGSFEPQIVRKGQTRLEGFKERIIALYARGMTTRDIRAHLREIYDVEVSPDLISRVTDAVVEELAEWQARPLDHIYPVIFIDALMIKIRDGVVANRPVYLAIGIDCDGAKQVLGLWVGPTTGESAKFWLTVLSDLKSRGVADVCIVCCDGLTGLPDAISVTWPQAIVQLCVVHLIRASLRYASKKYWVPLTKDLKLIYTAADEAAAAAALEAFAASWQDRYPAIIKLWRAHWEQFTPFLAFPPEVRRVIYTTDENVNPGVAGLWSWVLPGPLLPDVAARSRGQGGAPAARSARTYDLDGGEDRDSVGLVAGAADRRAKSRTWGLEVLPRCLACGLDESRPLAGGCARHLLARGPGGLPGGDHGAVGGLALGGQVAFGGADRFEGVAGGGALAAGGGGQPGAQLELALLVGDQRGQREGVVLLFDDQVPAQHGEFAGGGHHGDLHAAAGPHPLIERAQRAGGFGGGPGGFDQHAAGVRRAGLGDPAVAGGLAAGLAHPRVEPEIADQVLRGAEPGEVADRGHD
jgi:transposase-like protein